ncbi:MAG: GMP synthase [Gammaproteobacteria bacterium]|nr:GMP synthase [Gammaproteobacteria bacterium]
MHLGILQADSVMEQFQAEYGSYAGMFEQLLTLADTPIRFSSYVLQDGELPAIDACDAYLITGSRHSVYDDLPWIRDLVTFVDAALQANRKIIGICFGHQLVAHYFGGETRAADQGWGVGVKMSCIENQGSWMDPPRDELALLCSHKDQVVKLPDGAIGFASSEFCPCAGFVWNDLVLTFQGHPEFTKSYSAASMQMRNEVLGPEIFSRGMASLDEDTHEDAVAHWILNFLAK